MHDPQRLTAQVIFESTTGSEESLGRLVVQSLKRSCSYIRDATIVIAVRDEQGNLAGLDIHGTPSDQMQAEIDGLLDE